MRRPLAALCAAILLLGTAACSGDDSVSAPVPSVSASARPTAPAGLPSPTSPTLTAAGSAGTAPEVSPVESVVHLLAWSPVAVPPGAAAPDTVTSNGEWTLAVSQSGSRVRLEGPTRSRGSGGVTSHGRVSDALLDADWAVVVNQDPQERHPASATITELDSGRSFELNGRSEIPTVNGGTWAMAGGRLVHATTGPGGAYCLATVDLASRTSSLGWCAPARSGFNNAHVTPAGISMQVFDDGQPSCRTLVAVRGVSADPFPAEVERCVGWDGLLLAQDTVVWSVTPQPRQIEAAHFYARAGASYLDLGPGTSGTLTWCGGAAYFVRDPQRQGEPAALMRWSTGAGLEVVYQSPGGSAFLAAPRCGGDRITISAFAEDGDEQVTASVS